MDLALRSVFGLTLGTIRRGAPNVENAAICVRATKHRNNACATNAEVELRASARNSSTYFDPQAPSSLHMR